MNHSKSCRCKFCHSAPCKSQEHCQNWRNRFCKLRQQWSEHSKCGSNKQFFEEFTNCRYSCDQTVGRFGVAWVADVPDCEPQDPKGWQIEIYGTPEEILRKYNQLIKWLNNPPSYLYDNIEGNDMPCNFSTPKCALNTFEECCDDKYATKKRCCKLEQLRDNCSEHQIRPCLDSCNYTVSSDVCVDDCPLGKCGGHYCSNTHERKCVKDDCKKKKKETCFATCLSPKESYESNCRPKSMQENYCHSPRKYTVMNEGEKFRKKACCCQCNERFYKNVGTNYDLPEKEYDLSSDLPQLDSKVVCAGIRTSQMCKRLMEDKKNQINLKNEKEIHNTVLTNEISQVGLDSNETITNSDYYSARQKLSSFDTGPKQRRSNKFRKKESI